jgi:SSS family transporter
MSSSLHIVDWLVLASYLILVATIGILVARRKSDTEEYFLAGRSIPWWAAGLSILATETSALTFIGAPIQSLRGDWTYLQLAIGSSLARFLVAGLLLGVYYRRRVTTVYDFLADRFGPWSRNVASGLFFVGRLLASGVRLYGGAIALVVVADIDFPIAIVAIAAVATFYTLLGGLRSVIWTDMVQGLLLITGAIAALVTLVYQLDGSFADALRQLAAAESASGGSKLKMIDLSLDPRTAYTLFAGLIGSTLLTMSTHGTDQDMIQRALACRDSRQGSRSLWLSAFLSFPVAALFLLIGSLLWLNLGGDAGAAQLAAEIADAHNLPNADKGYDFLFPIYIVRSLPIGLKGLVIAAIFATAMSSLDSAISALSTTAVTTIWRPYLQPARSESHYLKVARALSFAFAVLLVIVALVVFNAEGSGSQQQGFGVLMLGLKVLSWIFPPLLAIFLVGVLTDRGRDLVNILALTIGIGALLTVEFWPALFGQPAPFAWTWNPLVGAGLTFLIAVLPEGTGTGRLMPDPT